jgi:ethanolamine ammonia-lyase large subunit
MLLRTKLFGTTYEFASVKEVLAKANEEKSGDRQAGIAATASPSGSPPGTCWPR